MPAPEQPTARLFLDLEGIAFDPLPCTINAVRRTLIRLGRPVRTDRDLSWIARQPIQDTLDQLLPDDGELRHRFLTLLREYYCRQRWHAARPQPQLPELLAGLGSQHAVERVVVSGNPGDTVGRQLADLGLEEVVDRVACPEYGGCANCRRRIVTEESERNDGAELVWLTDLPAELVSAQELGITGIGAIWGRISEGRIRQSAQHVAESPHALLASWPHLVQWSVPPTEKATREDR